MKRPLKLAAFGSGLAAETHFQTAISSVSRSFAMPLAFLTKAICCERWMKRKKFARTFRIGRSLLWLMRALPTKDTQ
jgi:hypothetical protein